MYAAVFVHIFPKDSINHKSHNDMARYLRDVCLIEFLGNLPTPPPPQKTKVQQIVLFGLLDLNRTI